MDKKTPRSLKILSNAKINLGLHILEKLPSGYHNIETIFLPVKDLYDIITIIPRQKKNDVEIEVLNAEIPTEQNLCYKAYKLLARKTNLPGVKITIEKNIPIGAGLGGGSSNAAFVLKALNSMAEKPLPLQELHNLAAQLGADVPFFLYNKPMFATGTGTTLTPVSIKFKFKIKLNTPGIFSDTTKAYKNFTHFKKHKRSLAELIKEPPNTWKNNIYNDLEEVVFGFFPELAAIKEQFYSEGAFYASMSGSGSAIFGLFKG